MVKEYMSRTLFDSVLQESRSFLRVCPEEVELLFVSLSVDILAEDNHDSIL